MTPKLKIIGAKKGSCYRDSWHILLANFKKVPSLRLVHGYPILSKGRNKGKRYGHAWVEFKDAGSAFVIDHRFQKTLFDKTLYYRSGKIREKHCSRYTVRQAVRQTEKTGHYGPWAKVRIRSEIVFRSPKASR